jgi:hypothetical protein
VGDFTLARKNEIFNASQTTQQRPSALEGVIKQDVMKEFGWEVPVDIAPLPSQGLVYPPASPLHGKESVSIKAMTAKEEDILMSRAYSKQGTTITELIKSCVLERNIDPNEMLSGDRQALLVAIRITGYGADYKVEVDCPACTKREAHEFDLSKLEIQRLEISPVQPGINQFETTLPVTKQKVTFKFMTGQDEQELSTLLDRRKKLLGESAESPVTTRLSYQTLSVANVTDKNKISTFISNMPAKDSLYLREYIRKHEPGLSMKTEYHCSSCGADSEVSLPMGASFFWPQS